LNARRGTFRLDQQMHVVAASFPEWTLDAFDFFLMVFVLSDSVSFGTAAANPMRSSG
jgi:hypothetical protein